METMEELLTAEEVAHILKLKVQTVYAKACKGEIPSIKVGGKNLRFKKSDIEKLIGEKFFGDK